MATKKYDLVSQVDPVQATIMKWGNSQGIRIPKGILKKVNLKENDRVEILCSEEEIIIRKKKTFNSLVERLKAFYGKPLEEISPLEDEEVDWGAPKGDEII